MSTTTGSGNDDDRVVRVSAVEVLEREILERQHTEWNCQPQLWPDLPQSIFHDDEEKQQQQKRVFSVRELFPPPPGEDRASLAGNKLSKEQLETIRKRGQFDVDSRQWPGEVYRWQLNSLLQSGVDNLFEKLQSRVGKRLGDGIVKIKKYFRGDRDSEWYGIIPGVREMYQGFIELVMLPFGKRNVVLRYSPWEIQQRLNLLRVAEFLRICGLADFDEARREFSFEGKRFNFDADFYVEIGRFDWIAYFHQLKSETLFDRVKLFQTFCSDPSNQTKSEDQIKEMVVDREYFLMQERILEKLASFSQDSLSTQRFIERLRFKREIRQLARKKENEITNLCVTFEKSLVEKHVYRGKSQNWLEFHVSNYRESFKTQLNDLKPFMQQLLENKEFNFSDSELFFLEKSNQVLSSPLSFEEEKFLKEQLAHASTIKFDFVIFNPKNWKVGYNSSEKFYYLQSSAWHYEFNTTFFGWRLVFALLMIAELFWNGIYYCFVNAYFGKYGIRSLFGISDFTPGKSIDPKTGSLIASGDSYETWFGKINNHFKNIAEERSDFEAKPDNGFFGKSFARVFHLIWCYIIGGFFGSLVLFLWHPIMTFCSVFISILLILTSFLWAPLGGVGFFISSIILYSPYEGSKDLYSPLLAHLFKFFIQGILNVVVHSFFIFVCLAFILCFSIVDLALFLLAYVYDSIIFYLIITPRGKVPSQNTFIAILIFGPGLSMEYFFRLTPTLAAITFQVHLENLLLDAYSRYVFALIEAPLEKLKSFFEPFKNSGLVLSRSWKVLIDLERSIQGHKSSLTKKIDHRKRNLPIRDYASISDKLIRMNEQDLNETLKMFEAILQEFVPKRLSFYMDDSELKRFWLNNKVRENDWSGLAQAMLKSCFGDRILLPIEKMDSAGFKIEVEHLDAINYFDRLLEGTLRNGFEKVAPSIPKVTSTDDFPESSYVLIFPQNDAWKIHPLERWLGISPEEFQQYFLPLFLEKNIPQKPISDISQVLELMRSDHRLNVSPKEQQ